MTDSRRIREGSRIVREDTQEYMADSRMGSQRVQITNGFATDSREFARVRESSREFARVRESSQRMRGRITTDSRIDADLRTDY